MGSLGESPVSLVGISGDLSETWVGSEGPEGVSGDHRVSLKKWKVHGAPLSSTDPHHFGCPDTLHPFPHHGGKTPKNKTVIVSFLDRS